MNHYKKRKTPGVKGLYAFYLGGLAISVDELAIPRKYLVILRVELAIEGFHLRFTQKHDETCDLWS